MSLWLGYGLSMLFVIWLSRFGIVNGGSELVVSAMPAQTPTLSSLQLAWPAGPASATVQPSIPNLSRHSFPPMLATLTTTAVSTAQNAVTGSPLPSLPNQPSSNKSYGSESDLGPEYGNVILINNCKVTLYVASVGVRRLGGNENATSTKEDDIMHEIAPGGNYTDPYRITCPTPKDKTVGYCRAQDKLKGQGVSMKVSYQNNHDGDVLQFEYALIKDPNTDDTFQRLQYDVSLLDCGSPARYPSLYHVKSAADLTDVSATADDHQVKAGKCPGYEQGISVSFPSDKSGKCSPIKCDGVKQCVDIYNFDRTREMEPSKRCEVEYRGDTVVSLCSGGT